MLPVVVVRIKDGKKVVEHARVTLAEYDELVRAVQRGEIAEVVRLGD